MKRQLQSALLVFCLVILSPIDLIRAEQPGTIYALHVDGLACPFCAYGVEKKLKAINGVVAIAIDIKSGVVRVTVADGAKLDESAARRAVEAAGFTLRRFIGPKQK